jgi:transposase
MRTSQKTPETSTTIGIDLGKNTFHLVGLKKRGAIVLQLKVSRGQLGRRLSNMPRCLIGMEACSGSHHMAASWQLSGGRAFDPRAVREAVPQGAQERLSRCRGDRGGRARPTMHFVAIKTPEQMDLLALHRVDDSCQRLMTAPGLGPITSSAVVAAIGNGAGFKQGRDFGAGVDGGDRTILGKISKRGNKYLRTLFVQAAHVVLVRRPSAAMRGLWPWMEQAS